jgi:hypothetical protein
MVLAALLPKGLNQFHRLWRVPCDSDGNPVGRIGGFDLGVIQRLPVAFAPGN